MAFIGIDIGTSGCKVCAYDINGNLLSAARRKYNEIRFNGCREIEPDVVRERIMDALAEAIIKCPEPIQAISVTCLGESLVCVDEHDKVLCNSMVTGDSRGAEGVSEIRKKLGDDYTFQTSGLMPSELYSLPKLIYLRDHTDVMQKTKHIFLYEDYIGYLLTGECKISYSLAARTMAFDIEKHKWDEQLLAIAGLTSQYFSAAVPSGTIIGYVKKELVETLHLGNAVPVVSGGHDQACAAIGSGFIGSSLSSDSIGTCECLAFMLPKTYKKEVLQELDMPCMPFLFPNSFFTTLEVTTCGALMNWARDTIFESENRKCIKKGVDFYECMDKRVTGKETNVLILPQFGSCGHPHLSYNTVGTISGLSLETTIEDIYIALKESMLFQIKLAHEEAVRRGLEIPIEKIVITGGAANSPLSLQLRADIFKRPVCSPVNKEAGTLGCMILCAVAIGCYKDIVSGVRDIVHYSKEVLPNPSHSAVYEANYEKFKQLYYKMHS